MFDSRSSGDASTSALRMRSLTRPTSIQSTFGCTTTRNSNEYENKPWVPFLGVASIGDEAGAKSINLQNPGRLALFAFPEGAIDIDTWEDWEKFNKLGHPERSEG